ncbi:MAG TPA: dihydrofolate reductase family protein [Actinocrinis sp.]|nr:dihydrofolate reductase family protein [Actinocrinis sp.]
MRKVVVQLCVSLDGFIEGPHGELDWHLVDEELHSHFNQYLGSMGAFLNGRVMHELMVAYWPTADQDPDAPAPIAEFARIWREMPKLVYSRTLQQTDLAWNATLVRDVVPEEVRRLKEEPGGDLALGGADLAAAFLRHGLIDEYRLYVQPVVIGAGKPLFPQGTARTNFRLLESRTFGNGVELLRYQCAQ